VVLVIRDGWGKLGQSSNAPPQCKNVIAAILIEYYKTINSGININIFPTYHLCSIKEVEKSYMYQL
jgi:hypothetical protein